jgi:formate hydrogenlyase transcriptional activator
LETLAYQSLLDVSPAILQHRDLAELFRDLSSGLQAVLRFDFLNLILHDPNRNIMRLHILETTTGSTPDVPGLESSLDASPSGWVFLQQKPLALPLAGERPGT